MDKLSRLRALEPDARLSQRQRIVDELNLGYILPRPIYHLTRY